MRLSTTALVLANLVPLLGTIAFGWSVFTTFALYWTESVVIGAYTILRLLTVRPGGAAWPLPAALALAAFFCAHFGLFLLVHGTIVVLLVGPEGTSGRGRVLESAPALFAAATGSAGALGLLALVVSHGVSFVVNFLGGERRDTTPMRVMFAPYPRIVAMHLVLLLGAMLLRATRTERTVTMLPLLVLAKIVVDVLAHRAEHRGRREARATQA